MNRRKSLKLIIGLPFLAACSKNPTGPKNEPPVITDVYISKGYGYFLRVTAYDPEGEELFYTWYCERGSFSSTQGRETKFFASAKVTYIITLFVSDGVNTVNKKIEIKHF